MSWFQVDDGLAMHPKVLAAGNPAMGLWVRCGAWSQQNLTNGFVPTHVVKVLGTTAQAKQLVTNGLWHPADGGYRFHEWGDRQLSAAEVTERRRARAEAGKKGGESKAKALALARANALANGKQNAAPVLVPVPSGGYLGGGVTEVDANHPPQFCPKHPDGTDEPCRACKRCREAVEAQTAAQAAEQQRQAELAKAIRMNCPTCHGTNWIPGTEPARHCNHQELAHA